MTATTTMPPFHVVIPARYNSTRLPGKPLLAISGRPMIRWVYENALASGAGDVIVATDDSRIVKAVEDFGGRAMMTSEAHRSGTDRIREILNKRRWADNTIIVNLQGDEPGIPGSLVRRVADDLAAHPAAGLATLATPIHIAADLFNPNIVKTVCDDRSMALYFSRAPIPWCRDHFTSVHDAPDTLPGDTSFLRHIGLYAYRADVLRRITDYPPVNPEVAESLEQLRALGMGIRIRVSIIENAPGHGVDTLADLNRMNAEPRTSTAVPGSVDR